MGLDYLIRKVTYLNGEFYEILQVDDESMSHILYLTVDEIKKLGKAIKEAGF